VGKERFAKLILAGARWNSQRNPAGLADLQFEFQVCRKIVILGAGSDRMDNAAVVDQLDLTKVVSAKRLADDPQFVEAARALGCSDAAVLGRHILANILGPITVMTTVALGWAMLIATSLNFLGMGVQPPTPEWGADLALGRDHMRTAWWISAFPGFFIMFTILAINLVGDGLRDAIDPSLEIR
jgi:ABC-type microcin C transport system permease subunit YejE